MRWVLVFDFCSSAFKMYQSVTCDFIVLWFRITTWALILFQFLNMCVLEACEEICYFFILLNFVWSCRHISNERDIRFSRIMQHLCGPHLICVSYALLQVNRVLIVSYFRRRSQGKPKDNPRGWNYTRYRVASRIST